jgi:predicted transcriptional regulator
MVRYVIKKSKQYHITKEGLELLHEHNGIKTIK